MKFPLILLNCTQNEKFHSIKHREMAEVEIRCQEIFVFHAINQLTHMHVCFASFSSLLDVVILRIFIYG